MQKQTLLKHWKDQNLFQEKYLQAFKKVKRENFILKNYQNEAYEDIPLPIGFNQTISQPSTVMIMTQTLEPEVNSKILEIGTGSGYQAALLSLLSPKGKIFTTEIIQELAEFAKSNLKEYENVQVLNIDGSKGYKEESPFDRIIFTCAIPKIENFILEQLRDPGILIAPIGDKISQEMIKITKKDLQLKKENLGYFAFVPLKGKYGFK
ncbi:protein-L-isoaspartate(D-aspartate) O-methyltransferase [Candidatus Woesearchaeota archaeon]|nr:protein-L-isoaspartate(D-aspartate) O-methyltransferase [Candidatus Woesearchaeota archaeon]